MESGRCSTRAAAVEGSRRVCGAEMAREVRRVGGGSSHRPAKRTVHVDPPQKPRGAAALTSGGSIFTFPRSDNGGRGAPATSPGGAAPRCAGVSPAGGGSLVRGIAWGLLFELAGVAFFAALLIAGAALC